MTPTEAAMSDQIQSIHEDLAFMKGLASDDGRMPSPVGAQFVAAGLIYGLPVFPAWASLRGLVNLPGDWTPWIGVGSTVVFIPVLALLIARGRSLGWSPGPSARAFGALWSSVGLTLVTLVVATWLAGERLPQPALWQLWPSILFAVYGSAWAGVAFVRRSLGWLVVALGSYATAIINGFLVSTPDVLLALAIGLQLWLTVPGLVMMAKSAA
jgi:hypothetical protein